MSAGQKGTQINKGIADNDFHSEQDWLKFCADHPLVMEWLQRPRLISMDYDIPYLGGISVDGGTVFLDRRYNPILVCNDHGHRLDSTRTIPDHEVTEYVCIRFYGMNYETVNPFQNPHVWGNTAERLAVMALDCDWVPYNKVLDRQLGGIELEAVTRCPPNLALYPYKDDPKLLARIQAAQQEG